MFKRFAGFLFQFGYWLVMSLALLILFFLSSQSLFVHTYIPLRISEGVEFGYNSWYFFPLLLLLLGGLLIVRKPLEAISEKVLFSGISLLYLVAGFYLMFHQNWVIRADAKHVFTAALAFNQVDYSSLTTLGGYMYRNPHQLGLMTLERLYAAIFPHQGVVFVFNLLMVLAINFLIYRITNHLVQRSLVNKYTILLTFLFFPQFFFILFAYGTTPGLLACLLSFYGFLRFDQSKKLGWLGLGVLMISLACLLRNNYILFAIMLMGILGLQFLKNFSVKHLLAIVLIVLGIFLSNKGIIGYYEGVTGKEIGEGTPKIAYVTMGLRDDPHRQTLGGWYDAYNTKILKRNHFDEKKATEMAKKDLNNRILYFIQHPAYTFRFFYQKVLSTWTEPTFQSIWTGPQLERQQYTTSPLLQSIYEEKSGYHFLNLFGSLYLSLCYLMSFFWILYKIIFGKKDFFAFQVYALIFLIGGVSFHFFWETKSQYVYIYILLLIPLFAQSIEKLGRIYQEKNKITNSYH